MRRALILSAALLALAPGGYEVGVGTVISSSISELDPLVRSVLGRLHER